MAVPTGAPSERSRPEERISSPSGLEIAGRVLKKIAPLLLLGGGITALGTELLGFWNMPGFTVASLQSLLAPGSILGKFINPDQASWLTRTAGEISKTTHEFGDQMRTATGETLRNLAGGESEKVVGGLENSPTPEGVARAIELDEKARADALSLSNRESAIRYGTPI